MIVRGSSSLPSSSGSVWMQEDDTFAVDHYDQTSFGASYVHDLDVVTAWDNVMSTSTAYSGGAASNVEIACALVAVPFCPSVIEPAYLPIAKAGMPKIIS